VARAITTHTAPVQAGLYGTPHLLYRRLHSGRHTRGLPEVTRALRHRKGTPRAGDRHDDAAGQSICDKLRGMLARNKAIVAGKRSRAHNLRARIAKLEAKRRRIRRLSRS
jgi:hypothetical protein